MSKAQSAPAVRSGMPLWLWFILIVVLSVTTVITVIALIPANLDKAYNDGIAAADAADLTTLDRSIAVLKRHNASPGRQAVLQALRTMADRRFVKAIEELAPAIEDEETKALALAFKGECQVRVSRYAEAQKSLEESLALDETLIQPRRSLAAMYAGAGAYTLALEQLEKLAAVDPTDARSMQIMGTIRSRMQDWEQAVDDLSEALRRDPRMPETPDINTLKAQCQLELGEFEQCLNTLASGAAGDIVDTLRAEAFLRKGQTAEAAQAIQESLMVNEDNPPLLVLRAEAALAEGDTAGAYSYLQMATRLKPLITDAHELLVDVCRDLGKNEEAARHQDIFERLVAAEEAYQAALPEVYTDIGSASMRRDVSLLAMRAGRDSDAMEWLRTANQLEPRTDEDMYYVQAKMYQDVLLEYGQAVSLDALEAIPEGRDVDKVPDLLRGGSEPPKASDGESAEPSEAPTTATDAPSPTDESTDKKNPAADGTSPDAEGGAENPEVSSEKKPEPSADEP